LPHPSTHAIPAHTAAVPCRRGEVTRHAGLPQAASRRASSCWPNAAPPTALALSPSRLDGAWGSWGLRGRGRPAARRRGSGGLYYGEQLKGMGPPLPLWLPSRHQTLDGVRAHRHPRSNRRCLINWAPTLPCRLEEKRCPASHSCWRITDDTDKHQRPDGRTT